MEKFKPNPEVPHEQSEGGPEMVYHTLDRRREEVLQAAQQGEEFFTEVEVLSLFTPEQQIIILERKGILSSLGYFIGKNFEMPIELGIPTKQCQSGWRQGLRKMGEKKYLQMNAYDLLNKPMDYLRFVTCHEGGHERVSRPGIVPLDIWQQPGFAFMMNAIEDPRMNNFVAESYPKFREQMEEEYGEHMGFELSAAEIAKKKLGYQPRFMQAGYEYIKQWFREAKGEEFKIDETLSEEIKEVVEATLASANDSWLRYPSREEADKSEERIRKYAQVSYEINRDEVWPEFKKLIEADMDDQKTQELLKDAQKKQGEGEEGSQGPEGEQAQNGVNLPQELKDKLTPEEQKVLEGAIKKAIESAKKEQEEAEAKQEAEGEGKGEKEQGAPQEGKEGKSGKPIDLASLPDGIKQKIKEYIKSLPEEEQREISEKAQEAFKEFEDALNEELQGKLSDNPKKKAEREESDKPSESETEKPRAPERETPGIDSEELIKFKDRMAKEIKKDANVYETMRQEVLPLIDKLETELREIFFARKAKGWESGFRTGKRIDIKKRIQEKAKSVPAMESKAWQKRELPDEKDYAISLLVDLSGSMENDGKIQETFKAIIVLAEVLNRLSINLAILGFNSQLYEYQTFNQQFSKQLRETMGGMIQETSYRKEHGVSTKTDTGFATTRAVEDLLKQKADNKFLITLTDGIPEPVPEHATAEFELKNVIKKVLAETDVRLIGLGIGRGTEHVGTYYPNSIANVQVEEMEEKLAGLIKDVIANYDKF